MCIMIEVLFPANPRLPGANFLQRYQITFHESSYLEQCHILVEAHKMHVAMKVRIVV